MRQPSIFVLAWLATSFLPALAEQSANSKFVDKVSLDFPGMAAVIHVKNVSADKHLSAINLVPQESKMDFKISGTVYCNPGTNVRFKGAHAYFGNVALGGFGQLSTSATLYTETASVAYKEKKKDSVEYTEDTFSVPLASVKNGSPSLKVDPVAEINKKLQAHIQSGGKAVDFYQHDQEVVLQRPISLAGVCGNNTDNTVGFRTKNHTIQIKYQGDSKVFDKGQVNAHMGNQQPNQIGNNFPYKLDKADFQPNMPDYTGKCVPGVNPKIRINFQASGSEQGLIDLRVAAVSNTYGAHPHYFETSGIINNPGANSHVDFYFPLKEMLAQDKYSYMKEPNKTWNHNMRVEARYRNMKDGTWSEFKNFDTAVFKHRCIPGVTPGVNNMGGVKTNDQSPRPQLNIKRPPVQPDPTPQTNLKVQSMPSDPKPGLNIKTPPPVQSDPRPQMNLKVQPMRSDPEPKLNRTTQPVRPDPADKQSKTQ